MNVTVIGAGYVGLVTAACLSETGNNVVCLDLDVVKISKLRKGEIPIYEPGLADLVQRNAQANRLHFTTDVAEAVRHGVIQFIAVGTPSDEDGSADLKHVLAAAESIGRLMSDYKVIVDKSTVPVGTGDKVVQTISAELRKRSLDLNFGVVSNPEFLKEGAAIADFMRPDRIVLGGDDQRAIQMMRTLYAPFQRNHERLIVTDRRSAELTKYAANAMLATRISFMNELANLAEKVGADIEMVRQGIASDPRIGYHFLYAGCGYGGSCFPKDVKALIKTATDDAGLKLRVLSAVEEVNASQKRVLGRKIRQRFGNVAGMRFAMWGLAFKPNTDDMREAPSRDVIAELIAGGACIRAYDPAAMHETRSLFPDEKNLELVDHPFEALTGADALIIVTEWKEFRSPDWSAVRAAMAAPVIFDGRNLYEPQAMKAAGFEYFSIGR